MISYLIPQGNLPKGFLLFLDVIFYLHVIGLIAGVIYFLNDTIKTLTGMKKDNGEGIEKSK